MSISDGFTHYATEQFDGHPDHLADRLKLVGVRERTGGGFIPCTDFADELGRRWRDVGFLWHYPDSGLTVVRTNSDADERDRIGNLRTAEMVALGTFPDLAGFPVEANNDGKRRLKFGIIRRIDRSGRRRQGSASAPERIEQFIERTRDLLELSPADATAVQA